MTGPTPRRRRIAFLTNDLSNTYQAHFLTAIDEAARQHDIDLVALVGRQLSHPHEPIRVQNVLYSSWIDPQTIDGVVVLSGAIGTFAGVEGVSALCRALRPIPSVSVGVELPEIPSIVIENRVGMRVAVEHLVNHHRRRRVAYIGGPSGNAEALERLAGYEDALDVAGLELDESLIATGDFTTPTGRDAMERILQRTLDFDALAVANDDMAIGATELLRERGIRVSEDVLVVSFDDTPKARYAVRPLTSIAQPTDAMAETAIATIVSVLDGQQPDAVTRMDVRLVLRESCGCGYLVQKPTLPPPGARSSVDLVERLRDRRSALQHQLESGSGRSRAAWQRWAPRLLAALEAELATKPGAFGRAVEEVAEEAAQQRISIDEISRKISELRAGFASTGLYGSSGLDLDKLWMQALATLSAAATRFEGMARLHVLSRANELRHVNERLSTALGPDAIAAALSAALRDLGVESGLLATRVADTLELEPLLAIQRGEVIGAARAYPARWLLPPQFANRPERLSLICMVLSFESDVLGLLAIDSAVEPFIAEALRSQLSASLKVSALHARVLEETALRERLAHEQLLGEMAIAKRIQTALAPRQLDVPALEIAAAMHPADQVGGDYYDVLPVERGCWMAVGDVTGHGLLSGLVMLMIQSIVSTLVGTRPTARPAELVADLNAVLFPNVRERLGQDEHATLVLLRYDCDGRVQFAGAHEDLVVYRAASGRCELVPTGGLWVGVRADIRASTPDQALTLEPGDVLVLYTDGVVEARNSHQQAFGLPRLCQIVEANAHEPVERILTAILDAVRAWFPVQQDDVTCLVARYTGDPTRP